MSAVGSIVFTDQDFRDKVKRPVRMYTMAWIASAGGAVSGIPSTDNSGNPLYISGTIVGVEFTPGSPAPTALYDVTLTDEDGFDVLAGNGANLSATVVTRAMPGQAFTDGITAAVAGIPVDNILTLVVANAGNAGAGKVRLYLR